MSEPLGSADPLLSPEEAADLVGSATFLDVRWRLGADDGHELYLAGHVPGAAYVDLEVMRANAVRALEEDQPPSVGKLVWAGWHRRLGELAMQVAGAGGLTLDAGSGEPDRWQRLFLFSRADTICRAYASTDTRNAPAISPAAGNGCCTPTVAINSR